MASQRTTFLLALLLLTLFAVTLSACGILPNQNQYLNPNEKYYTGTQGIVPTFSNFPNSIYYYGPQDPTDNSFTIGVELRNLGASFSRGGIYLSGFDPKMMAFQEVPILGGPSTACGLSIGTVGFGELGGILRCDGLQVSSGGGVTNVNINDLNSLIAGIGDRFNQNWFNASAFKLGVSYTNGPQGSNFIVNVNNMVANIDYYQHGRLFIALFAALDFTKNGGQEFLLAGRGPDFPQGEYDYKEYHGKIINWQPGMDSTTQTMLLTSCYQYTTFADPMVCIDPDPTSNNYKVCQPKSTTWNGGNGAPVTITSVEQVNNRQNIHFIINIRNSGAGTVYDPGKLEKCSPYYPNTVTPDDLNVVYLGDVRVGNVGLGTGGITCSPQVIRLDPVAKTGSTSCTYMLDASTQTLKSAYVTPLFVELWYGYSEVQQRTMTIRTSY